MQRSLTYQRTLRPLLYVGLFIIYSSLATIYPVLPPLFGLLFLLFIRAVEQEQFFLLLLVSFCLLIFEANNGYLFFSSIFYIYTIYKFILPRIEQSFNCYSCIKLSYILLAYIGYFLFSTLISKIFLLPAVNLDYYIIYYIVIEFFLVSLI